MSFKAPKVIHTRFKIRFLFLIFFLTNQSVIGQYPVINEILSDNETINYDCDEEFSDWIEIYNPSEIHINLENYSLSDDFSDLNKWKFPEITISPNEFLLIFASGKSIDSPNEFHCDFKISAEGEGIYFCDNSGNLIDSCLCPELEGDISYARIPDGIGEWTVTDEPSPASENIRKTILNFSHLPGFYNHSISLHIESDYGDSVFYTLDGSVPTFDSHLYMGRISIEQNFSPPVIAEIPSSPVQDIISYKAWESPGTIDMATVVRAASCRDGKWTSGVYSMSYFIYPDNNKYSLPVISLITDANNLFDFDSGIYVPGKYFDTANPEWSGNYFRSGSEWERPVHIEYFDKNGIIGFSQEAGMRIHGAKTCQAAQKTLRLYAREEYGEKYFNYPLLPAREVDNYKRFLLRTSMGSWGKGVIIKDVVAHEIVKNMDIDYQEYQPVIVFINGEYWGIHTLRDRVDEYYIEYLYGVDNESVDIINGNYGLVEAGTNKEYIKLAEFIASNDLVLDENYSYVLTMVDINNLIDYSIAETFFSNWDWPGNNQKLWRSEENGGKWRWIFFDLDAGFGNYSLNMFPRYIIDTENTDWKTVSPSSWILSNLLKNKQFKDIFITRYAEVLNNDFMITSMITKLNNIKELYEGELPRHISRWHFPESVDKWEKNINDELVVFLKNRPNSVTKDIKDFFNPEIFEFHPTKDFSDFITIAPNPSNGSFCMMNANNESFIGTLRITSATGQTMFADSYYCIGEYEVKNFYMDHLSSGIYFLTFHSSCFVIKHKLVIVH